MSRVRSLPASASPCNQPSPGSGADGGLARGHSGRSSPDPAAAPVRPAQAPARPPRNRLARALLPRPGPGSWPGSARPAAPLHRERSGPRQVNGGGDGTYPRPRSHLLPAPRRAAAVRLHRKPC
ncbi:serpin E3 [Platysternon megacephalum]|uniref:Serpin E3 n=1 Tax=Platysternon megacephalum TaxID=55544 RepID=A0A4D9EDB5_9SAUR|nr:serpin E3 [Platysternon megacephalum]